MQNPENLAKNLVNPVSAAGIYPKKITTVILTAYKTPPSLCAERDPAGHLLWRCW